MGDLVTFSSVRPASSNEHTHLSFELTVEDDNTMVGTEEWIWIEGFGRPDEQRCTGVSTLTATRNP